MQTYEYIIKEINLGVIINEYCYCKHARTTHNHSGPHDIQRGHGNCTSCNCEKFMWKRWYIKKLTEEGRVK